MRLWVLAITYGVFLEGHSAFSNLVLLKAAIGQPEQLEVVKQVTFS